jgi:hypothetical protein
MDPPLVAHARRTLREAGATIVPVPADLLHLKRARTLVDQVRQEVFLARRTAEARRDKPASQLPACDLPRLVAHLKHLANGQQLPACFGTYGQGVILSLELWDEADLTAEALEALRVIIDELNELPAP